jgi:hypothetical protein
MYFQWLSLQHFASSLRNLLLNYPVDNSNMLRRRKLQRYYIYFIALFERTPK